MSIFFDFQVGPCGRKFRRAIDLDKHEISLFMDKKHTELLFGEVDVGSLIELSTLAICQINEQLNVVGFLALHDRPNVPAVPAAAWQTWMRNMYHQTFLPHNTLFIHMLCCAEGVNDTFLGEALTSVFKNDEYLLQIVLVAPPSCAHEDLCRYKSIRNHSMKKISAKRAEDDKNVKQGHIYLAYREDFYTRLTVRAAVEEDNDDVVEILDNLHPSMRKLYGDYYVSEMIGRHPESPRKIVVAQHQDKAVGVMCLNSQINYEHLMMTYELAPYFGLRKATGPEKEELRRTNSSLMAFGFENRLLDPFLKEPIMGGKLSPFDDVLDLSVCNLQMSSKKSKSKIRKTSSHVMFKKSTALRRSFDNFFFNKHSDDYSDKVYLGSPSVAIASSIASLQLDEDPFDYDIVNIDSNLLAVPEVLPPQTSSTMVLDEPATNSTKSMRRSTFSKLKRMKKQATLLHTVQEAEVHEQYHGEPNAFSIEIYALREDIDERKAYDLLEAAFEIMKDYDYCLIRLPCYCSPMYLLRHFCV